MHVIPVDAQGEVVHVGGGDAGGTPYTKVLACANAVGVGCAEGAGLAPSGAPLGPPGIGDGLAPETTGSDGGAVTGAMTPGVTSGAGVGNMVLTLGSFMSGGSVGSGFGVG